MKINLFKMFKPFAQTLFLFAAAAIPVFVFAADYIPLAPLTGPAIGPVQSVSLGGYFSNMYTLIIGVAGVLSVLMIVIAGIEYMTPTPSAKESGKKRALAAILGLLLALISYLILQTINPDLIKSSNLNLPSTTENQFIAPTGNSSTIVNTNANASGNTSGRQSTTGSW